jgi:hypothetical protein
MWQNRTHCQWEIAVTGSRLEMEPVECLLVRRTRGEDWRGVETKGHACKGFVVGQERMLGRLGHCAQGGESLGYAHPWRLFPLLLVFPRASQKPQELTLNRRGGAKGLQALQKLLSAFVVRMVFDHAGDEQIHVEQRLFIVQGFGDLLRRYAAPSDFDRREGFICMGFRHRGQTQQTLQQLLLLGTRESAKPLQKGFCRRTHGKSIAT